MGMTAVDHTFSSQLLHKYDTAVLSATPGDLPQFPEQILHTLYLVPLPVFLVRIQKPRQGLNFKSLLMTGSLLVQGYAT
jgi:hypothetical protein